MPTGAIDWIEIPASDPMASARFYERLFGWKIQTTPDMDDYPMFMDSADKLGGGFARHMRPMSEPGVMIYLTVESIDQMLPRIASEGGQEVKGKTLIGENIGWWASFRDPGGNVIGLYERKPQP